MAACGAAATQRRDPEDGGEYTLQELEEKWKTLHGKDFSYTTLNKYWLKDCRTLGSGRKKKLLVIRHGQAQHNLKGMLKVKHNATFETPLGPNLTEQGQTQARGAGEEVAETLEKLKCSSGEAIFTTSNLVRALETTCLLAPAGETVHVQPLLRERVAGPYDRPSELSALRQWIEENAGEVGVDVSAYDEVMAEVLDHEAYVESCWAADCVANGRGGWSDAENKASITGRAAKTLAWLEALDAPVVVVVGHSCFLPKITGDTNYMENGELRLYDLHKGMCTRIEKVSKSRRCAGLFSKLGVDNKKAGSQANGQAQKAGSSTAKGLYFKLADSGQPTSASMIKSSAPSWAKPTKRPTPEDATCDGPDDPEVPRRQVLRLTAAVDKLNGSNPGSSAASNWYKAGRSQQMQPAGGEQLGLYPFPRPIVPAPKTTVSHVPLRLVAKNANPILAAKLKGW